MYYEPLLQTLKGRPVMLEVADPARQSVDIVKGILWDLFFQNTLTLIVTWHDENIPKPADVVAAENAKYRAQQEAAKGNTEALKQIKIPTPAYVSREFQFRWVRTNSVIMVHTDANVKITIDTRQIDRPKAEPLYTDALPYWHMLNNGIALRIHKKVVEMGLKPSFTGLYRNDKNEDITMEAAEAEINALQKPQPVANPPVTPAPAPQAVPVEAPALKF